MERYFFRATEREYLTIPAFRVYARNLVSHWLTKLANLAVMLLLSRYVIHALGPAGYGVWSLMVALTSYLGLAELGVRVSTGRYINYYLGRGENGRLNEVVSVSLAFFAVAGGVVVVAAAALAAGFGQLFPKVLASSAHQALWVLPLLGLSLWLGFFSATFVQLLAARQRFDLVNAADLSALAVRAGGTWLVLAAGGGLVALAGVQVVAAGLSAAMLRGMSRRWGPPVRIAWRYVRASMARELLAFGGWAMLNNICIRIVYSAGVAVAAWKLGIEAAAFYSVAILLIDNGRELVNGVNNVFAPELQQAAGRGDLPALRSQCVRGVRMTMLLAIPLLAGFAVFGGQFLRLWLGDSYAVAARTLTLLALANLANLAAMSPLTSLEGLGHVRMIALLSAAEAAANVTLGLGLAAWLGWGIDGLAVGTLVPMLLLGAGVRTWVACRAMRQSARQYAAQTMLHWVSGAALTVCGGMVLGWAIPAHGWMGFVFRVTALCAWYLPVGWYIVLGSQERAAFAARGRSLLIRLGGVKEVPVYETDRTRLN